jgi:hypothetical protein
VPLELGDARETTAQPRGVDEIRVSSWREVAVVPWTEEASVGDALGESTVGPPFPSELVPAEGAVG